MLPRSSPFWRVFEKGQISKIRYQARQCNDIYARSQHSDTSKQ